MGFFTPMMTKFGGVMDQKALLAFVTTNVKDETLDASGKLITDDTGIVIRKNFSTMTKVELMSELRAAIKADTHDVIKTDMKRILKKELSADVYATFFKDGKAAGKAEALDAAKTEAKAEAKAEAKKVGEMSTGKKIAKYGFMGLFGAGTMWAYNKQSAGDCFTACVAGTNHSDGGDEEPSANCSDPSDKDACKTECDKNSGLCSDKLRRKRSEAHCGGFTNPIKMAKCAGDTAAGLGEGGMGFFEKYAEYIVYGVWFFIIMLGLYLMYKFLTIWTQTKVSNLTERVVKSARN